MFDVSINFKAKIAGCPEGGIEAVEFRRSHGIPEAPRNLYEFAFEGQDRSVCESNRELLDCDADLKLHRTKLCKVLTATYHEINNYATEVKSFSYDTCDAYEYKTIPAEFVSEWHREFGTTPATSPSRRSDMVNRLLAILKGIAAEEASAANAQIEAWKAEHAVESEKFRQETLERKSEEIVKKARNDAALEKLFELSLTWNKERHELIRMRRENGFDWVGEALDAFQQRLGDFFGVGALAQVVEDLDADLEVEVDVAPRRRPDLEEIKFFLSVKDRVQDLPKEVDAEVELIHVTYNQNGDESSFTEVRVECDLFGVWKRTVYLRPEGEECFQPSGVY